MASYARKAAVVLVASSGASALTCSGSADPTVTSPQCYSGSVGALDSKESIHVKVDDYTAPKGNMELTGSGIKTISCKKHSFSKSGQAISVDLSDCLPSDVAVNQMKYCSDQDAISVIVEVQNRHLPITPQQLTRVDCASMEAEAPLTCSGSADPKITSPQCYSGSAGALGVKEAIHVKVDDYSAPKGHMDLNGDGILKLTCGKHSFSKSGQEIATDLSDCLPGDVSVSSVKYCSDQDSISVTVKDKKVPLPITAQLSRVDCASNAVVV